MQDPKQEREHIAELAAPALAALLTIEGKEAIASPDYAMMAKTAVAYARALMNEIDASLKPKR